VADARLTWGGLYVGSWSLRRTIAVRPIKPVPRRVKEPGSGTTLVTMFVCPFPRVADATKNDVPRFIVSATVVPFRVAPVNQVPLTVPLSW